MKQTTEFEEPVVTGFITEGSDGEVHFTLSADLAKGISEIWSGLSTRKVDTYTEIDIPGFKRTEVLKGIEGLNQSADEINQSDIYHYALQGKWHVIDPPYCPRKVADLLHTNEVHYRAVRTKVTDAVNRNYTIDSFKKVIEDDEIEQLAEGQEVIPKSLFNSELEEIRTFIHDCNPRLGFEEVLRNAAQDWEAIGWAAIEVTRNPITKKIEHIQHIPAARIKVLRNWEGFVEESDVNGTTQYTYYQNFGEKVRVRKSIKVGSKKRDYYEPYDPVKHGPLDKAKAEWNLVDPKTGETTDNVLESANEVLWLVNSHPNTIYYGFCDAIPALSAIQTNTRIKDYTSQFFDNNTVPRYAVIVEGANVDAEFRKTITEYFSKEVRGQYHKTMVLAIPHRAGKTVSVKFERVEADRKEADFLETYKANSQAIQVAHGTSPAILGIAESAELGSGKGLSQAELYKDRIVTPRQKYWQNQIYRLLSKGLGIIHSYIKFDPYDVRDMRMQAEVDQMYLLNGVKDINEVRTNLGMESIPGGNVNFLRTSGGQILKIQDLNDLPTTAVDQTATQTQDTPPSTDDNVDPESEQT